MSYFSTKAITLGWEPFNETDAMIRVLSKNFGLLELKAKSIRKGSARLMPLKEPGMLCDFLLYGDPRENRILSLLTGEITEEFASIRQDFTRLNNSLLILSFVRDFSTPFDTRSEEKFSSLLAALGAMHYETCPARYVSLWLRARILNLSGWSLAKEHEVFAQIEDELEPGETCSIADLSRTEFILKNEAGRIRAGINKEVSIGKAAR
ncbi:DNA repair protein RecO [Elusimicrobiota bacterium]